MVLIVTVATVEVLVWVLIYGGLLTFALGLALRGSDGVLAHGLSIAGLLLAAVGACLVWVRSRMVARNLAMKAPVGPGPSNPP